jgi:uncharacterized membrane protein YoaK (UPF0700 family)
MTGNVVFLAFAVAGAPGLSMTRSGVALVAFLIGALIGGRLAAVLRVFSQRHSQILVSRFYACAAAQV